jgi:hypothetical protein
VYGLQMTGIGGPMLHFQTPEVSGVLDVDGGGDGVVKFAWNDKDEKGVKASWGCRG